MQAKRVAIFFSAATLAGAFGGILAYGIEHLDGQVTVAKGCSYPLISVFTGRVVAMVGS